MFSRQEYEERQSCTRGYFYTSEEQALKEFAAEEGITIKYRNELCSTCDGEGTQALHGMVLTQQATEDREFMEDYMAGLYDTKCEGCNGNKVVKVMNEDCLTPEQLKAWHKYMREVNEGNAESLAELRMGC